MTEPAQAPLVREIAPGLWWLPMCAASRMPMAGVGDAIHVHSSIYLIMGSEQTLLVDAGSPRYWGRQSAALDLVLDGRPLDWVMPTHPEIPHAGNLHRLLMRYPDVRVGGDIRDYHLYYPEFIHRFVTMEVGDKVSLGGGHEYELLSAPIRDLVSTTWGYEKSTGTIFTSDAFSYTHRPELVPDGSEEHVYHLPGECDRLLEELNVVPDVAQAVFIVKAALYWTRYVRVEPYFRDLEQLLESRQHRILAPAHGNVITNIDAIMPVVRECHRLAYLEGSGEKVQSGPARSS